MFWWVGVDGPSYSLRSRQLGKEGSTYDLTLALGILTASKQLEAHDLEDYIIMGELSMDGSLQPIRGALPIALKAMEEGFKGFLR